MLTLSGPATSGPPWFERQRPDRSWPSVGVSILATTALFASAAVAMKSAPAWFDLRSRDLEPAVAVHLSVPLPAPATRPKPPAEPITASRPPQVAAQPAAVAPATIPIGITPERATAVVTRDMPIPAVPPAATPDSSAASGTREPRAATLFVPSVAHPGAANAPAGVTARTSVLTPAARDSIMRARMASYMTLLKGPVYGADRAGIERSQLDAAKLHRSATSGGGDGSYAPGSGMYGVGVVKPGTTFAGAGGATNTVLYSIPFPLFYPGPSPEQRRRDSIVHADNMARLARLEARADSLAKRRADSIAKARVVP